MIDRQVSDPTEPVVILRMTLFHLLLSEVLLSVLASSVFVLSALAEGSQSWQAGSIPRFVVGLCSLWGAVVFIRTPIWFVQTKGAVVEGTATELRHNRVMKFGGFFGFAVERITTNLDTVKITRPPAIELPVGDTQVRYDFVSSSETLRVDTQKFVVPDDLYERFRRWQAMVADAQDC